MKQITPKLIVKDYGGLKDENWIDILIFQLQSIQMTKRFLFRNSQMLLTRKLYPPPKKNTVTQPLRERPGHIFHRCYD